MINTHHHAQNPENVALLNLVEAHGSCSGQFLLQQLCHDPDSRDARKRFTLKLGYLVYSDQLSCEGRGGLRGLYTLGSRAGCAPASAARVAANAARTARRAHDRVHASPAAQPPSVGAEPSPRMPELLSPWQIPTTATAPAYDSMHAPAYVPPAMTAMRPGALDYRRIASHGHRC